MSCGGLKETMEKMFDELRTYLDVLKHSDSAATACKDLVDPRASSGLNHVKEICKVLVKTVYWMGNLQSDGKKKNRVTKEDDWKQYLKCVIGNEVILRVLGNKCKAKELMKVISDTMKKGGSQGNGASGSSICSWVNAHDIDYMNQIIGTEMQEFINKAKKGTKNGGTEGFVNIVSWMPCEGDDKKKEELDQKAKPCHSDRIMDLLEGGMSAKLRTVIDPIEKAKDCIQQKKDGNDKLCERLKCMEYLWNKTDPSAAQGNNTFWNENSGEVKKLWEELSGAMTKNDTNGNEDCNKLQNPSDKTACNYLHAGFEELYKKPSSPTGDDGILSKNNPSFRQTMGCFLLHAYAKHMKEKATCLIDEGISKAFTLGEGLSANGIKCKWDENNTWENCTIKEGSSQNETEVKNKLNDIVTKDDSKIVEMAKVVNTMDSLCDGVQCVGKRWLKEIKKKPKPGTALTKDDWKDFWEEEVKVKLNSLFNGAPTAGSSGTTDTYCTGIPGSDNANEEACRHMAKLLNHMYTTTNGSPNKYSDQIINCLLLNAYAKKLKDEAKKKGFCSIDEGIEKAFANAGKDKSGSGFSCQWKENDYEKCSITTSATTTENNVKTNVESLFSKNKQTEDPQIQQTLINFNKNNTLCERVKCAAKWYKDTTGKEKFWEEYVKGKLSSVLSDTAVSNGGTTDYCKNGSLDNANKEACKLFTAKLELMYKNQNGSAGNNKLSDQIIQCSLLKAYAEKLKDKAQKEGYCDIESGLKEAFEQSSAIMNNGASQCGTGTNDNKCFECKWDDNTMNDLNGCTTGSNNDNVKDKVESTLEVHDQTKDPQIQQTLTNINNKNPLCRRLQCLASRVHALTTSSTHGASTTSAKDFWTEKGEVATLWKELSDAMKGKGKNGNEECNNLTTPSEKTACKFLHGGFQELYKDTAGTPSPSGGDNKLLSNPSFRQTMGCFLLHAYAKHMKEKATCLIDEGIEKAFELGEKLSSNGTNDNCKGGKTCIPCKLADNAQLGSCQITTNGANGQATGLNDKVEDKLKTIVHKDKDPNIRTMLTKINEMKTLCDRVQCVSEKWLRVKKNKMNGESLSEDDWNEMWTEVQTQVTELDKNIGTNKDDTEADGLCKDVQCTHGNADGCVSKDTCKLIVKALMDIHKIKKEGTGSEAEQENNRIFKSTMRCVILNAFAQKLRERAEKGGYACAVQRGIEEAFNVGGTQRNTWCRGSGKDDGSCEECERRECTGSRIGGKTYLWTEVMNKLNTNTNTKVQSTLSEIKKKVTLCDRVNCIANWYHKEKGQGKGEEKFWTEHVKALWEELSEAMKGKGNDNGNGVCAMMGENGTEERDATDPERKACNYLHAGLKALYNNSSTATTTLSPSSTRKDNQVLNHKPFRRTMGCLLLHAYAKKMKDEAKCEIEAGIKKAFLNAGSCNGGAGSSGKKPCVPCQWDENILETCQITTNGTPEKVEKKLEHVESDINKTSTTNLTEINKTESLCDYIKCAGPKWFKKNQGKNGGAATNKTWCEFWDTGVKPTLQNMFQHIASEGQKNGSKTNPVCEQFGDGNNDSVERKACNHITAGLQHIKDIQPSGRNGQDNHLLERAVGCIALNMYADQIINEAKDKCPIDENKIKAMFDDWNKKYNKSSSSTSCNSVSGGNNNGCFVCKREKSYEVCQLSVEDALVETSIPSPNGQNCEKNKTEAIKVQDQMKNLLNNEDDQSQPQSNSTIKSNIGTTLSTITNMTSSFCTQIQCAAKKYYVKKKNNPNAKSSDVSWSAIYNDAATELAELLKDMNNPTKQKNVDKYCDNDANWKNLGHKEKHTNKAACLLFAAGLEHIYTHGNDQKKGPSFVQTMGCLFLKEYAKQLKELANKEKKHKVHPRCSVDSGIDHAFSKSNIIMNDTPPCSNGNNSCFVCTQDDYNNCQIGKDEVKPKVEAIFKDQRNKEHMQQTLENTVCPILLTDILTPFLPLAPVSIGLSAMAYYLWKYFGPLGKGGARFRRSPAEIPGSSVQEQVLDHVQQDSSHEYRLVKERKPRSAPTRTKRSGPVNRRTIIEIHFEVLDECQKGDTQLAQKDFLELLVQEFMGSELMEEEQVSKEEVPMESVPMELVPIEEVPSLGSGLLV
ncbi:SICAvar, type I [Plasmodium knowlesi strain H]|uniref:SICAvar, type I n=2 Tax=Plasmodium knowlesi TaxID=5850 RepID=A0A679KWA3_PLAKH|nr:SICAvar, type I [Plasmodium knowlesi strain H]OTN65107.1 SICAvar type I [Plasmodium knowlesi]CAA9988448.1 SICAvar, type I [Plasmodium knowlesi strain H]VVS77922.1 SICAvar, type I [Plasmodium knowlesi strain H]